MLDGLTVRKSKANPTEFRFLHGCLVIQDLKLSLQEHSDHRSRVRPDIRIIEISRISSIRIFSISGMILKMDVYLAQSYIEFSLRKSNCNVILPSIRLG